MNTLPTKPTSVSEREQVDLAAFRLRLQTKPGMYLLHQEVVDGASMYLNLMATCIDDGCFQSPQEIRLSSQDEYHRFIAQGSRLLIENFLGHPIPTDLGGYENIADWLQSTMLDAYYAKQSIDEPLFLAAIITFSPVIYAAHYCMLDMTTEKEHLRQMFYQGKSVSPCERRKSDEFPAGAPCVAVRFTLDKTIFKARVVSQEQIVQGIDLLRSSKPAPRDLQVYSIATRNDGFEIIVKSNSGTAYG